MPQLNPMIPLDTPKGEGFAFWRTDYSQEHDTLYTVIITSTREIWEFPTPQVRGVKNISMGRTAEATPFDKPPRWVPEGPRGGALQWVVWRNRAGLLAEFPPAFNPNDGPPDCSGGPWMGA